LSSMLALSGVPTVTLGGGSRSSLLSFSLNAG
jgi:hypothetical protein